MTRRKEVIVTRKGGTLVNDTAMREWLAARDRRIVAPITESEQRLMDGNR